MARRRKPSQSGLDQLLASPWWLSAILAVATYALSHWILPGMVKGPLLMAIKALMPFGTFLAILFAVIAAVLFFKQKPAPAPIDIQAGPSIEPVLHQPSATGESLERAWKDLSNRGRPPPKPDTWSLELQQQIEWHRFEQVAAAYFREKGFRCETTPFGADGGIDARIYKDDQVAALVQCKAWNSRQVGAPQVRELYGVMMKEGVGKGYFMATGRFSEDAKAFAADTSIVLVDGEALLAAIGRMDADTQARLLAVATEGDYMTPTCPSCGIKMVWRDKGSFWGCSNYPRCKQKLHTGRHAD